MKKPHVLNRAMFNRGGISAYGRGITSNLVTEEQRQRFNDGGRVGFNWWKPKRVAGWEDPGFSDQYIPSSFGVGPGKFIDIPYEEITGETAVEDFEGGEYIPFSKQDRFSAKPVKIKEEDIIAGPPVMDASLKQYKKKNPMFNEEDKIDVASDTIDWEELLGPTEEQKKRTKGEAQLGLAAGALDVFSQPTIAKGMKAASPHLLNLGKTATADQKATEKAILQGKILDKVYRAREKEKGTQAMNLAMFSAGLSGDAVSRFRNKLDKGKSQTKSLEEVLGGIRIPRIKRKKDGSPDFGKETPDEGDVFATERGFLLIEDGDAIEVSAEEIINKLTPAPVGS
jgi:hypothetical protein